MPLSIQRSHLLLALPGVLALIGVSAVGYSGLNGQDAHDYLAIARGWTAWLSGGPRPAWMEHPHGYPMLGALVGVVIGVLPGLRLVSWVSYLVVALLVHRWIARDGHDRRSATAYVLLGTSLAPFVLRYALTTLSDLAAMAWVMAAFGCFMAWCASPGRGRPLLMFTCLAMGLLVRSAVAPVALLMLALATAYRYRITMRWGWLLAALLGGAGLMALAMHSTLLEPWVRGGPLAEWSPVNWFQRVHRSDDGVLRYALPNILYGLGVFVHPGQFPLGLLLLPFVRGADLRSPLGRSSFILALGYLLFVAGMPFQNDRVLLLAQPFVVLFFHPAFTRAMGWVRQQGWGPGPMLASLAVVQVALFIRAMVPFIQQAHVERELATSIAGYAPVRIYTHGMGAALGTYCPGIPVTELWYAGIDNFQRGALVVIRPEDLAQQWNGLPPAVNWDRIQQQGTEVLAERRDGWVIARVR